MEYFTMDMELSQLRNLLELYEAKSDAEILLMDKKEIVACLNEHANKIVNIKHKFFTLEENIDLNNLNITNTKSIPLITESVGSSVPTNANNANNANNKKEVGDNDNVEDDDITSGIDDEKQTKKKNKKLKINKNKDKPDKSDKSTKLNKSENEPSDSDNNNNSSVVATTNGNGSDSGSGGGASTEDELKKLKEQKIMDEDRKDKIEFEARNDINNKNNELKAIIIKKCKNESNSEKNSTVSKYKKIYAQFLEKYIQDFYIKHLGPDDDTSGIGSGKFDHYTLDIVETIADALKFCINICVPLSCIKAKPEPLLTEAKMERMLSLNKQLELLYTAYYEYNMIDRSTFEGNYESMLKKYNKSLTNIDGYRGNRKKIQDKLKLYNFVIVSNGDFLSSKKVGKRKPRIPSAFKAKKEKDKNKKAKNKIDDSDDDNNDKNDDNDDNDDADKHHNASNEDDQSGSESEKMNSNSNESPNQKEDEDKKSDSDFEDSDFENEKQIKNKLRNKNKRIKESKD